MSEKRVLEIVYCSSCVYWDEYFDECENPDNNSNFPKDCHTANGGKIPAWCPLPKAEEKK